MASFRRIRSAGLQRGVRAQVSLSPRGLGCPDRGPVLEATADAGRWMQAPPQHAKDYARTPQRLGGRDQASDLNKGAGEPGVVGGGGMEPAKVGVDRPDTQSAIALDAGEDQVAANDDAPHGTFTTRARSRNNRRGCGATPRLRWRPRVSASIAGTLISCP
jgi:hypothetical protein